MTGESPDLLGRKSLYRHLERELGNLTTLPRVMTARQGKHHAHVGVIEAKLQRGVISGKLCQGSPFFGVIS